LGSVALLFIGRTLFLSPLGKFQSTEVKETKITDDNRGKSPVSLIGYSSINRFPSHQSIIKTYLLFFVCSVYV